MWWAHQDLNLEPADYELAIDQVVRTQSDLHSVLPVV